MTHADTWGNMELMKVKWDSQRDGIPQDDYDQIKAIITESMYAAETALQGAETMCAIRQSRRQARHAGQSQRILTPWLQLPIRHCWEQKFKKGVLLTGIFFLKFPLN